MPKLLAACVSLMSLVAPLQNETGPAVPRYITSCARAGVRFVAACRLRNVETVVRVRPPASMHVHVMTAPSVDARCLARLEEQSRPFFEELVAASSSFAVGLRRDV